MNFATETASNAMMFAPGGGFAKGAGRLGLINPNGLSYGYRTAQEYDAELGEYYAE